MGTGLKISGRRTTSARPVPSLLATYPLPACFSPLSIPISAFVCTRFSSAQNCWAEPVRTLLIRLSGRLMKRGQPYTAPALLAGLWVLLALVVVLDDYSVADLRRVAAHALPVWQSPQKDNH